MKTINPRTKAQGEREKILFAQERSGEMQTPRNSRTQRNQPGSSLFLTFTLSPFTLSPFALSLWPLAFLFASAISAAPANPKNNIKLSQAHIKTLGIALGKLEPAEYIPMLTAPAKVVVPPAHEYLISASQAGLITQLNASIGDRVAQGDVLAELNSPDLLSLQRQYLKAENELQLAQLSHQRDKKLFEEGIIAERRWQETRGRYNAVASEANEQKQLLKIAGMTESEIKRLKIDRRLSSQLRVLSPISGTVTERIGMAGSRVDILAPLYRIANLDELWLELGIPQERAAEIKIGDGIVLEPIGGTELGKSHISDATSGGINGQVTAKISLVSQTVNPENQTVLARAVIDGPSASLRPGQRINTQILQKTARPAFKVANTAIAQNEGRSFLFIRIPDGFRVSPVTVIGKQGEESVVSGDLTGAEEIAVKGAVALKANWLGLGNGE